MNSAMAGILSGVAGGAGKYQEIQDEQRKYTLEDKKAQQELNRRESFARYNYTLQDSGLRNTQGRVQSNQQVDAMSPEEQSALEGVGTQSARFKAEADEKVRANAASVAATKKGGQMSQYYLADGTNLTNDEAAAAQESGTTIINKHTLDQKAIDSKQGIRDKESTKKEDLNYVKDIKKDVDTTIKSSDAFIGVDRNVAKSITLIDMMGTHGKDPRFMEMPEVKHAMYIEKNAPFVLAKLDEAKQYFKSRAAEQKGVIDTMMRERKVSRAQAQEFIDYLKATNQYE